MGFSYRKKKENESLISWENKRKLTLEIREGKVGKEIEEFSGSDIGERR